MDDIWGYLQEVDPIWAVVLVAAALVVLLVVMLRNVAFIQLVVGVLTLAIIGGVAAAGYFTYLHFEDQRRLEERRALEERAEALFQRSIDPESVFACLDGSPAPAMHEACERSLFAEPQRVAAAIAIVTQRLVFLSDAVAFIEERDPSYASRIDSLRSAVEADPFGFVAFVLSVEHRCTVEACPRFSLLRDAEKVKENMRVRRLEAYLAKHSVIWRGATELPANTVPTVGGRPTAPFVSISGGTVVAPPPSAETPLRLEDQPVVVVPEEPVPVTTPMVPPPSVSAVAAEPPAAAAKPAIERAKEGFDAPPVSESAAAPAPARAAPQQRAKQRPADPATRRSAEPVAGLPRIVPGDFIRAAEEKEAASAQPAAPAPREPTSLAPPQQNLQAR